MKIAAKQPANGSVERQYRSKHNIDATSRNHTKSHEITRNLTNLTNPVPAEPPDKAIWIFNFRRTAIIHRMAEFDVKYTAHLARLALTADEEKKLGTQLGNILGYIEKLRELDVTNVEPTAHAVPMVNITRADEVRPSLPHDEALRNAPKKAGGLFIVPKIVE